MAGNKNLNRAAKAKFDEFYTRIEDIENECGNYKKFFRDKIILCNCDDPYESKFFQYFAMNFNVLGLKKLISSSYAGSLVVQSELNFEGTPNEIEDFDRTKDGLKAKMTEFKDWNGDGREDLEDVKYFLQHHNGAIKKLYGDKKFSAGDFRSPECIELLKQADIVVTNPPFSLFREYIQQLIDYDKKFLIIGSLNAVTYKEIFPLIMQNKIWLGYGFNGGNAYFSLPGNEGKNFAKGVYDTKTNLVKFRNLHWFTNLDVKKRHENIRLMYSYEKNPEKYPKYDNFDAIEVSKTLEIPKDYFGVMGVPISFLNEYNPEQFEIVGVANHGKDNEYDLFSPSVNGKNIFKRILIRRKVAD